MTTRVCWGARGGELAGKEESGNTTFTVYMPPRDLFSPTHPTASGVTV